MGYWGKIQNNCGFFRNKTSNIGQFFDNTFNISTISLIISEYSISISFPLRKCIPGNDSVIKFFRQFRSAKCINKNLIHNCAFYPFRSFKIIMRKALPKSKVSTICKNSTVLFCIIFYLTNLPIYFKTNIKCSVSRRVKFNSSTKCTFSFV